MVDETYGNSIRIIPAYAGSTNIYSVDQVAEMGSSPHTRGARSQQPGWADDGRIIPAYAGSTWVRSRGF